MTIYLRLCAGVILCHALVLGCAKPDTEAPLSMLSGYQARMLEYQEKLPKDPVAAADIRAAAEDMLQSAVKGFVSAGAASSDEASFVQAYADALAAAGDADLAAEQYARLVEMDPQNAEVQVRLAESLADIGPTGSERALTAAKSAIASSDTPEIAAAAESVLAQVYWDRGLYEFALAASDAALAANPESPQAKVVKAAALARAADVQEASALLDSLGAQARLLDSEVRTRLREALRAFDSERRWFDDTAANHAAYARLLYRAARVPEATMAARRALELSPDGELWKFLGDMLLQLGTYDQAREAYEESLKLIPNQPQVQRLLEQMRVPPAGAPPGAAG